MAVVGSAYVVIRAITEKLEGDISAALNGLNKTSGTAGSNAGKSFSQNFANEVSKSTGAGNLAEDIIPGDGGFGNHGEASGRDYVNGVTRAIVRDGAKAEAASGGVGGRVGRAFSSGFSRANPGRGFTSMAVRIAVLVPILGAIVAALSTLASGLFAVGASALQASASLAVLPGVLGAIIQGAGSLVVAFGGIGKAVQAGLKPATQTAAQATQQQVRLQRSLRDAHQAVTDAVKAGARAEQDARAQITAADQAVIASHQAVRDATNALSEARKQAKEDLIDLQFAAEGGALAEERAQLALEQAFTNLAKVRDLPPDNRLRRDAELTYKEADLNLRQIKERNGDIAQEQKKAKKEGINGQDAVVAAQERLRDAHRQVKDAITAQREAQERLTEVQQDSARSIRDAQERLQDAQFEMSQYQKQATGAAGGTDLFARSMENLSPQAQHFVKYLLSIKDNMRALRAAAGEELFPKLESAIGRLVNGFFPQLEVALRGSGSAMGDAANTVSKAFVSGPFSEAFASLTKNNNDVIRRMGTVLANLAVALVNVFDAAKPLINEFTRWMVDWSERVKVFSIAGNRSGEMADMFVKAGNRMQLLIRIVKNIVEGIRDFGKIAAPEGTRLLKVFEKVTKRFADFTDTKENRKNLRKFFEDVGSNFESLSTLIAEVSKAFLRLGSIKGVDSTSKALLTTVPLLEDALGGTINELGPKFVDVINAILRAFNALSQAGALETALGIFEDFFNAIAALMNSPLGPPLAKLLGFLAALKAIQIIRGFPGISLLDKALVSLGGAAGRAITNIKVNKAGATLGQTLKANLDVARGVAVQRAKLIAGGIKDSIIGGIKGIGNAAKRLGSAVTDGLKTAGQGTARVGRNVGTRLADGLKSAGSAIKSGTTTALGSLKSGLKSASDAAVSAGKAIGRGLANGAKAAGGAIASAAKGMGSLAKTAGLAAVNGTKAAASFLAQKAAMVASAAAAKVAAAAQWLLNAAMSANPIVLIVIAIAALVAAFVLAYKNSEKFREIVNGALKAVGDFFVNVFEGFKAIVQGVWDFITGYIQTAIAVIKAVFTGDFGALADIAKDVFNKILGFIKSIFGERAAKFIQNFVVTVVKFFSALPGRIANVAGNVLSWLYEKFRDGLRFIGNWIGNVVQFYANLPGRMANAAGNIFGWLYDKLRTAVSWIGDRVGDIVDFFRSLPGKLGNIPNPFSALTGLFTSVLKTLQDLWNRLDLSIGFTVPDWVPKYGGQKLSIPDIFPDIHMFASGGIVQPTPGGVLSLIGEAGQAERIEPLDADGLSKRDRAIMDYMLRSLTTGKGDGDTIHVYPSPGMDEEELAALVLRKKQFNRRRGT